MKLAERLQLKVPLVVAPMAGGPSSPELVIASSEAGALGTVGAAYSSPSAIQEFVEHVRKKTSKPIAINLFVPTEEPKIAQNQIEKAIQATEKFRKQLGLPQPELKPPFEEDFDRQFEMVLKLKPEVFTFVFGLLSKNYLQALQKENILVVGTATTLDEALALQESGVDAVTLQGIEAGGHRGIFDSNESDPEISLRELLNQCRPKIKTPIIAAGGIMNSKDIQEMLLKGADLIQMGTAFLNCKEAGTSTPYRKALTSERKTKTTRAFSGRLARGIENTFMRELDPSAILPFPAQNKFTRDIRAASAKQGRSDFLSLWSGTGQGQLWAGSATELIRNLFSHL